MRGLLDRLKYHWLLMSSPEVKILKECAVKGKLSIVAYGGEILLSEKL